MVTGVRRGTEVGEAGAGARTPRTPARLFIFAFLLSLIASHRSCELHLPSFPRCLPTDGWRDGWMGVKVEERTAGAIVQEKGVSSWELYKGRGRGCA